MSLVKYIARLQRFYLLLAGKTVNPPYELVCWMNIIRGHAVTTSRAEKENQFVVIQSWSGTYIIDVHCSIWSDAYQSISGYSNWSLPERYNNKCHNCISIHLIQLKVFPTFQAADFSACLAV